MAKFNVGDRVKMPDIPMVVEVLELGVCDDEPCELGSETFRFQDPFSLEFDWLHTSEFELAPKNAAAR